MKPTITAVMVTLGKTEFVCKSYSYFNQQTYPSKKLLIVTDGSPEEHRALQDIAKKDRRVSVLHVGDGGYKMTLGELRNLSIEHATSDLTIQWDDDDWYGPTRIMEQWQGLGSAKAVMLMEQLHYFRDTGEVAWTVDPTGIQGTLLLDRRCGLRYPPQRRGEDTVLKDKLSALKLLNLVEGGTCYCRTYHGNNTWGRKHHTNRCKNFSKNKDQVNKELLSKTAKFYNWREDWKLI